MKEVGCIIEEKKKESLMFLNGLEEFLDFDQSNSISLEIRCHKEPNKVTKHLMIKGFVENYYEWDYH